MTAGSVDSIAALEAVIGKTPPPMHLKVIDHLDAGARRWIAESPLMFAGSGLDHRLGITLAGGPAGFATAEPHELRVPIALFDAQSIPRPTSPFGGLFLLPGIGETLRVNGHVKALESDHALIAVEECYGHCAKAIIRSDLWTAGPATAPDDTAAFVAASRFLALATVSTDGRADLSPKGDPAGCMALLDGGTLWFADRPGNRRVDSFRNIVEQPKTALALIVPGATKVAIAHGRAFLTTDPSACERFTVKDRTPQLAIGMAVDAISIHDSLSLRGADLWPVRTVTEIDPAKLFVDHIKRNKMGGIGATLARASLSVPGMTALLKKGLDKDYKYNLY